MRRLRSRVSSGQRITLRDLYLARARIAPWIRRTPLVASPSLSALGLARVFLKLETAQDTGAFKLRGATNFIRASVSTVRAPGVVTVSTGNHGRAVAHAARCVGARAIVCMSKLVPGYKRAAIEALGAEIRIVGQSQDEAEVEAQRLVAEEKFTLIHPFDDPLVIAGQGTVGIEILEDQPEIDTVIVGLSGGGLISGIALAVKAANPHARVVGVTMDRGAAMYESVQAGHPVEVEEKPSLADSLGGGIGLDNRFTFDLTRALVDDYVLVTESEIARAMRHLYWNERVIAEGGGAVSVAAVLAEKIPDLSGNVVCVVSGGNIDMTAFTRIVTEANR
ncbi:MAG: hydroxyectoine utilization dehydratase EutB [Gammaproteobacteria bacterium]|nr:hydroxyectoine utilization dehydratase EutB [Gammaproteobacteria bacterium]